MKNQPPTVDGARDAILRAVEEVRAVARVEHDEARAHTADWLDGLFADVAEPRALRDAVGQALALYGGMGSFADVGTAASARGVDGLAAALRDALRWAASGAAPPPG